MIVSAVLESIITFMAKSCPESFIMKSGLFSFKYAPTYCLDGSVQDEHFERAVAYEGVLEESRKINLDYYFMLANKYDLV